MILKPNKTMGLIGLATKAGKTAGGEFLTEREVKSGRAALVIVAEDASENTKKKFNDMCRYYQVPIYTIGSKEELGRAIGKEYRASLAFTDENFSRAVINKIEKTRHEQ